MAVAERYSKYRPKPNVPPTIAKSQTPAPPTGFGSIDPSSFGEGGGEGDSPGAGTSSIGAGQSAATGARASDQPGFAALSNPAAYGLNAMGINLGPTGNAIAGLLGNTALTLGMNAIPGGAFVNMGRGMASTLGNFGDRISNALMGPPGAQTLSTPGQGPFTQGELNAAAALGISNPNTQGFRDSTMPTGYRDAAGRQLGVTIDPTNFGKEAEKQNEKDMVNPNPEPEPPGPTLNPDDPSPAGKGDEAAIGPGGQLSGGVIGGQAPDTGGAPGPGGAAPGSSDTPGGQAGNAETGGAPGGGGTGTGGEGGATGGGSDAADAHTGGQVPGGPGNEPTYRLQGGETVVPRGPMADLAAQMLIGRSPIRNYMDPRSTMLGGAGAVGGGAMLPQGGQPQQQQRRASGGGTMYGASPQAQPPQPRMPTDPIPSASQPRQPQSEQEQLRSGSKSQESMQRLKEILIRFSQ